MCFKSNNSKRERKGEELVYLEKEGQIAYLKKVKVWICAERSVDNVLKLILGELGEKKKNESQKGYG